MLHKTYWVDIPDEIKIWYGDNFIKDVNPAPKSTLRNVMGPAGFVTEYIEYDGSVCEGTTVECETQQQVLLTLTFYIVKLQFIT